MKVKVYRSAEWVATHRIERARNVPECIDVEIDPAGLDTTARQVVLATHNGRYPEVLDNLSYNDRYEWCGNAYYGRCNVRVDSDSPSVEDINRAILFAAADLLAKRNEKERAERERAEADRRLKEARELLGAEIASKDAQIKELQEKRLTLAQFIARVPADAKRGTLKAMARDPEAVEALKDKVEAAAPGSIYVLNDVDTDEDEDDQ